VLEGNRKYTRHRWETKKLIPAYLIWHLSIWTVDYLQKRGMHPDSLMQREFSSRRWRQLNMVNGLLVTAGLVFASRASFRLHLPAPEAEGCHRFHRDPHRHSLKRAPQLGNRRPGGRLQPITTGSDVA